MKNIKKGFLLNFAYEGSHIIFKLLIFSLVFYLIQVAVGYNLCKTQADFINSHNVSYEYDYLKYSQIFNNSAMPYILVGFVALSFVGIYFIFQKDKIGSNKINAIYTLPFPRYCNFIAKFFYCILCPLSVYMVQILANMTIMIFNYNNISFRDNEIYLSSRFTGFYQICFSPSLIMLWFVAMIIFLVSLVFHDFTARSVNASLKTSYILSFVMCVGSYTSIQLIFSSKFVKSDLICCLAIAFVVIATLINLFLTYRKVKV